MSANNAIFIDKKTLEVWYQSCADNNDLGSFIKKCKTLKEAVNLAQKLAKEYQVEYGIRFIN